VRIIYAGAGEALVVRVMFAIHAVGEAVGVCSTQAAMALLRPDLHLHRQRTPSSTIYLSRAYLNVSDCVTHIWPIPMPMVCNNIPHDPPRMYILTYVHTYFVRIDSRFRARANALGN